MTKYIESTIPTRWSNCSSAKAKESLKSGQFNCLLTPFGGGVFTADHQSRNNCYMNAKVYTSYLVLAVMFYFYYINN